MEAKKNLLTYEGLKALEDELHDLKVVNRKEVAEKINELAENSGKNASKKGDDDFDGEGDDMLPQAIEVVVEAGQASTSLLQRRLRLGYARAGRIIDELEQRGIIGPHEGSKPRQVLITRQQMIEMNLNQPEE